MNKYCVEIERECEDKYIHHFKWVGVLTRDNVLQIVKDLDIKYDDKYGKITYYEVFNDSSHKS